MAVLVVDLFEVVYIRHEDTQWFPRDDRTLQAVLELLVEAFLGEQPREVVAVYQVVQGLMKLGLHGIVLRELQRGVADRDPVSVAQLASFRVAEGFAVQRSLLTAAQIPHHVSGRTRVAAKGGVPASYLY